MKTIETEVAIIGAGTSGLNARREVEKSGKRWLLIESGPYGTTCARVGCMPSKLLIAAADAAHGIHQAARFGIKVDPAAVEIDGSAVLERVRRERDRFVGFVVQSTEDLDPQFRIRGRARFAGPTTLHIDDHTEVRASSVVIATGSSPWIPPQLEPIRDQLLVNDDVFEWTKLPSSIAVFGTGIIGLELGQALMRLGVRTTFFNPYETLGPFSDPKVAEAARRTLGEDLDLQLGTEPIEVKRDGDEFSLRYRRKDGTEEQARFEQILVAAGRRPNLAGLGLETTGLALDKKGQPQWNPYTTQCGDRPIFLAGDVSGHRPLLHEAGDEGRIAGSNAVRYPNVVAHTRRTPLAIAFTEPQMAMVGKSYRELDPSSIAIGEVSYEDQGRARVMGQNRGFARIYADPVNCVLLGAEMFGPRVEHTSHLLAWAVQQRLRVHDALSMPFYHPVIEEGIRTLLRSLAESLQIRGGCPPEHEAESAGM
ncbi:MAG: dihydrolipoyl dehydrogenase [Myxococcota bacterium]